LDVWIGRCRQQAIVIRKGQTAARNDSRVTGAEHYVRRITFPASVIVGENGSVQMWQR
jgi:hypothetical protein